MSQTLVFDTRSVALELYHLLRDLDPSRWDGVETAMRRRIAKLESQLERVRSAIPSRAVDTRIAPDDTGFDPTALRERISEIVHLLRDRVPQAGLSSSELREAWTGYRLQLQHAYEALGVTLRTWSVHVPSLRPTNYARSTLHIVMGLTCVLLLEEVLSPSVLWVPTLIFASTFWCLEGLRHVNARARSFLLWIFRSIAHPHERFRVNSSTWFATALVLLAVTFEPLVCAVAVVILGVADPVAGLVGRRFGRIKLVNGRTLEGSVTFLLTGALAAFAVMSVWHRELSPLAMITIAVCAALPAMFAELTSRRIDDNFSVPVVAGIGAWAAVQLLAI